MFVYRDHALKLEIKHFIDCVAGKAERVVSVEHELECLRTALVIDTLLQKGAYGEATFNKEQL
jgi:predicted dehydrogenase